MNQSRAARPGRICRTCKLGFTGTAAELRQHSIACVKVHGIIARINADNAVLTPDPED